MDACPECEYPLRGLAGAGACPECGFPYDASTWSVRCIDVRRRRRFGRLVVVPVVLAFALTTYTDLGKGVLVGIGAAAIPLALLLERVGHSRRRFGLECALVVSGAGITLCRTGHPGRPLPWGEVRWAVLNGTHVAPALDRWRLRIAGRSRLLDVDFAAPSPDAIPARLAASLGGRLTVRAM